MAVAATDDGVVSRARTIAGAVAAGAFFTTGFAAFAAAFTAFTGFTAVDVFAAFAAFVPIFAALRGAGLAPRAFTFERGAGFDAPLAEDFVAPRRAAFEAAARAALRVALDVAFGAAFNVGFDVAFALPFEAGDAALLAGFAAAFRARFVAFFADGVFAMGLQSMGSR